MLYHWAALAFPPRVEEDMLNFERIFRHDCRISVTKILVSGFPSFMGKFATSGDGVHTSVHVSQLPGKASTRVATACARSQRVAKTVAPSYNVVHFCTIRPLVDEKPLPEVAMSQHVAMTAVRPCPSVGTPSPQVGMPKNRHPGTSRFATHPLPCVLRGRAVG